MPTGTSKKENVMADVKYTEVKGGYIVSEDIVYETIVYGFDIETDYYHLKPDGTLSVSKGFFWDGATGAIDTDSFMDASLVHDIFCILVNERKLPKWIQALADELMRMMTLRHGMSWLRRMWTYLTVRMYQINKGVRKWKDT